MAQLTLKERLQPSLLDRLTDDEPHKKRESREQRVLSMRKLREAVLRDLNWLLNSNKLSPSENLDDYPRVASSVVNYGLPDLAGTTASSQNVAEVEQVIRQTIWDFEPRILRNTLNVRVIVDPEEMSRNALTFEIHGELWAQPVPLRLFMKTEIDLENGIVTLEDYS